MYITVEAAGNIFPDYTRIVREYVVETGDLVFPDTSENPALALQQLGDAPRFESVVERLGAHVVAGQREDALVELPLVQDRGVIPGGTLGEAVHQSQVADLLAGLLEAAGDRVRHHATERPAQQVVGPLGLDRADNGEVVLGDLLDAGGQVLAAARQPARLQPVEGPVRQVRQQARVSPAETAGGVDAEQRGQVPGAAQRHQHVERGPSVVGPAALDGAGELLDGGRLEQGADGQ